MSANEDIEACLKYLSRNSTTPAVYHASQAGTPVEAIHDGTYEQQKVHVKNGRHHTTHFSIDQQGFQLLQHSSAVLDFYNDHQLETIYNIELENLLKKHIVGAKRIRIFDHTRRSSAASVRTETMSREPSSTIHNDYTERSATQRLRDFFGTEAEDILSSGTRFAIVNVWKPLDIVQCWPLALCDSTTLKDGDIVAVKRLSANRVGEIQMAHYNPDHVWYYFPSMTSNEAILFKTFDSNPNKCPITIHTSFPGIDENSMTAATLPPRRSIETRAFVFY